MRDFWTIFTDMKEQSDEKIMGKLQQSAEYQATQEKRRSLTENLDNKTRMGISDAYTEEETIYEYEVYLAGLKDGYRLAQILQSDVAMFELFNEKKAAEERAESGGLSIVK